ncbi:MAG: hypothetical protein JO030_02810 [Candidatus Eremiobacteraeota bacterium]|nr:hypothetical protein [Candidatus Eremiobacteraeota bacterium]
MKAKVVSIVRSLVRRIVACTALVCLAAAAASASAAAQATNLHFTTSITPVYGSQYPITGRLDIEIFPGGNLRGYYHTTYYKVFIPVVGGRDGNYIWMDIGPSSVDLGLGAGPGGKLHVVGTMSGDGSFRGQVYPETEAATAGVSMQAQAQSSSPSANDQYVFSALPTTDIEPTPSS